jgi:hypothetical protein
MQKKERSIVLILRYLNHHRLQARILISALSLGFVLVAVGVMFNLMSDSGIIKTILTHFLK